MADANMVQAAAALAREPKVVKMDVGRARLVLPNDWDDKTPSLPVADVLPMCSLTAMRDYIAKNADGLELDKMVLHVENECTVSLIGRLGENAADWSRRPLYAKATALLPENKYGWRLQDDFTVYVATRYAETEERRRLLEVCGALTDATNVESMDDGVTQRVTVSAGVMTAAKEPIKNPFTLKPYRSFLETEQVESPFLLRIKKADGAVNLCLFECDGGAWRNTARRLVVEWLKREIPAVQAIG